MYLIIGNEPKLYHILIITTHFGCPTTKHIEGSWYVDRCLYKLNIHNVSIIQSVPLLPHVDLYVCYDRQIWQPFCRRYFYMSFVLNGNLCVLLEIFAKIPSQGPNNNISSLVQMVDWHNRKVTGHYPRLWWLTLLTHICVTQSWWVQLLPMMTSSNGSIFRVTGPLFGEFTGHWWIPLTKAETRSLDVFFDLCQSKRLSKQSWGWWFETPSFSLWRHYNDFF